MNSILASAHTSFLESYEQGPYADLFIRLVEEIKGTERQTAQVDEQGLGAYFPVTIQSHSRCATVRFRDLRSLLTYTEDYDAEDPKMELLEGNFLRRVKCSGFREFIVSTTTAIDEFRGDYSEWLVWTKEQIFQVLAGEPPEVPMKTRPPDFSIERGKTWSAS